jgi:hypothetical protein
MGKMKTTRFNRGDDSSTTHKLAGNHAGFILPLVVLLGLILAVGGFTMLARSFAGLFGATRQEQARQAREIAETGLATTVELLNRKYSYLLINCYPNSDAPPTPNDCVNTGTWQSPQLPSSTCPGSDTTVSNMPLIKEITTPRGRYRIEFYAYAGTQFYGGTGKLKITGERLSSNGASILASASVEQTFDVKPKPCDARFGDPATSTGFPGLIGKRVTLGNNDIFGQLSGNILCTYCSTNKPPRDAIKAGPGSIIDGEIFIGRIAMPAVPRFPFSRDGMTTLSEGDVGGTLIRGGDPSTYGNYCKSDGKITHCIIESISLKGNNLLTVDTSIEPVRIYVDKDVEAAGNTAGISHVTGSRMATDAEAMRLGLFGVEESKCANLNPLSEPPPKTPQSLTLSGLNNGSTKLFAYFPCGTTILNGSPSVTGAIWSWNYDGSNSTVVNITVPDDAGSQLFKEYGTNFGISIRDYVALGVNSWRGYQGFAQ